MKKFGVKFKIVCANQKQKKKMKIYNPDPERQMSHVLSHLRFLAPKLQM